MTASINALSHSASLSHVEASTASSNVTSLFQTLVESGCFARGRVKQLALATTLVVSAITATVLVCLLPLSLAILITLPVLFLGLVVTALIQRERTYLFADRDFHDNNRFSLLTKDFKGSCTYFKASMYTDEEKAAGYLRQAPLIFVDEMIYPEKELSRPNYGRTNEMLNFHKIFNKASAVAVVVFSQYASNSKSFDEERVRIEQHTITVGWWILDEHYKTYSSKPYEVIHIGSDQNQLTDSQKASLKKVLDFASHPLFFI